MKCNCPKCKRPLVRASVKEADCRSCHKRYEVDDSGNNILNPLSPLNILFDPYGIWRPASTPEVHESREPVSHHKPPSYEPPVSHQSDSGSSSYDSEPSSSYDSGSSDTGGGGSSD